MTQFLPSIHLPSRCDAADTSGGVPLTDRRTRSLSFFFLSFFFFFLSGVGVAGDNGSSIGDCFSAIGGVSYDSCGMEFKM